MLYSQYNHKILLKIKEQLEKQMRMGYDLPDNRIMLRAFELATRENGALDFRTSEEEDAYRLGIDLFLSKYLTII